MLSNGSLVRDSVLGDTDSGPAKGIMDDQQPRPGRRRVTAETAIDAACAAGLEPMEPYPGHTKRPWRCRAVACGHEVVTDYNKIQQRGLQCRECGTAKRGLSRRVPPEEAAELM